MQQIAIQVKDDQKAAVLVELLHSLDFVSNVEIVEANNANQPTAEEGSIFYQHPSRRLMESEAAAFAAMHHELVAQYLGKYIAMYQGQVIDFDDDEKQLVERIAMKYPDAIVLIRQVQTELPPPLVFRSPHLVYN
jgi:hypothetical protein